MIVDIDELTHVIKQIVLQQMENSNSFWRGHISTYDPIGHKVRVIIPSLRDQFNNPVLSDWMPLGTQQAGGGYGIQVAPKGGASANNPTAGEQVLVGVFSPNVGIAAVPCQFYTDQQLPPGAALQSSAKPLLGGEVVFQGPSGSYIRMHQDGLVEAYSPTDATLTAASKVVVNAPVVDIGAAAATFLALMNTNLITWLESHEHSNGNAGGNTGVPTTSVPADASTTNTFAS